jgi:hypothetical protein
LAHLRSQGRQVSRILWSIFTGGWIIYLTLRQAIHKYLTRKTEKGDLYVGQGDRNGVDGAMEHLVSANESISSNFRRALLAECLPWVPSARRTKIQQRCWK